MKTEAVAFETQGATELRSLRQHEMDAQVRVSDLDLQLGQLHDQQDRAVGDARLRLNKPVANAQHDLTVAMVDLEATRARINVLERAQQSSSTTPPPPLERLVGRLELEKLAGGVFLLMLPIMFALSRRIWVRRGPTPRATLDPESNSRLLRIEEAIESIAVEVERIGEGQRFTTKLLSERQPEAASRLAASSAPVARREPGTVTPH